MSISDDNVIQGGFSALGHAGSNAYVGLEIIALDDVLPAVSFQSDEFTAVCPVTGQPDLYDLLIELENTPVSIESKSLKIYLSYFRNTGCFAENLVWRIKRTILDAIDNDGLDHATVHEDQVTVTITQKRRGGIEIEAVA